MDEQPLDRAQYAISHNVYLGLLEQTEQERDAARRELAKARWIVQLKDMTVERLQAQVAALTEERDALRDKDKR